MWALLLQKASEETAITNLVTRAAAAGSTVGALSVNVSRSTVVGMGMGLDVVGVCVFNPLWH